MPTQKLRLFAVSAVILVGCAVGWLLLSSASAPSNSARGAKELRKAPDFVLKDLAGKTHALRETRGKLTLVHFWAAWCPPCLSEIPELVDFAEHFKNDPHLAVIAISLDEKWSDAERVLQTSKLPANMISLLDAGAKTPDAYGTYQFPETYLLNFKGEILVKWVGGQPWNDPRTEALIQKEIDKESAGAK